MAGDGGPRYDSDPFAAPEPGSGGGGPSPSPLGWGEQASPPYQQSPGAPAPYYGGQPAPYGQHAPQGQYGPHGQYVPPGQAPGQGLYVVAAVINWVTFGIIVLVTFGFGLLVGAWFIPMTIAMHKAARDRRKHTALGVCSLLFCNIVSGILILVADAQRSDQPSY